MQEKIIRFCKIWFQDLKRGQLFEHAYSMAYISLLSLVPSLAVSFSVVSLFTPLLGGNSEALAQLKSFILKHLAAGSGDVVIDYLESFIANVDLKKIGFTGFAGTLASLILLLKNIEVALNRIFEVKQPRSLFIRFIYFWTIITLGTFLVALVAGIVSGFELNFSRPELTSLSAHPIITTSSYLFGLFLFFAFVFKVIPNRYVKFKYSATGALVASFSLSIAIEFFSFYTRSFKTYEAIYGAAFSAIPFLMIWIYIVWLIVLACASLTWRLQKGFQISERGKQLDFKPEEQHLQHRICASLPEMLLRHIELRSKQDDFSGFYPLELAKHSSLPSTWIDEAIVSLVDVGALTASLDLEHPERLVYFPKGNLDEQRIAKHCQLLWSKYESLEQELHRELY